MRRLSFDLPAFDSVWVDSLVQLRLLTPYQAKMLEKGQASKLRVGPYVIVDELGRSAQGATFLARRLNRRDSRVIKRLKIESGSSADVVHRLTQFQQRSDRFAHPHIVLHDEVIPSDGGELIPVSRFVAGLPLNELLIRRGRFAPAIVMEIGRQLLDGLAALHAKSLIHGDIRLSNVRLTDNGLAVLVDGGLRQVIRPEFTIHDNLSLEAYDGMAPELIGTGEHATVRSELYSLGCLLWQLLAGRPPFTSADPLVKLASHQTNAIDDVRVWAPDTPALLATTIAQMTAQSPDSRPRNCNEILQRWGKPSSVGRSRVKQFRRLFDGDVPHFAGPLGNSKAGIGIWLALLALVSVGMAATLHDRGLRTELLEIVQRAKTIVRPGTANRNASLGQSDTKVADGSSGTKGEQGDLLPFPSIRDGTILLDKPGPYQATDVSYSGDLVIRGAAGIRPEIRVDSETFELVASSVSIEGVIIRTMTESRSNDLINIRSPKFSVTNCEIRSTLSNGDSNNRPARTIRDFASVSWNPRSNRDSHSCSIEIENTVFYGSNTAVSLAQPPGSLRVTNTLKVGDRPFVAFGQKCHEGDCKVMLNRLTLRDSGPIFELAGEPASRTGAAVIQIEAANSVFHVADGDSGLVVIASDNPRSDPEKSVKLVAENSVVAQGTQLLTILDKSSQTHVEVDTDDEFDGLVAGEIQFAGNDIRRWKDSRTVQFDGPKESDELPGVKTTRLGPARRSDELQNRDN